MYTTPTNEKETSPDRDDVRKPPDNAEEEKDHKSALEKNKINI